MVRSGEVIHAPVETLAKPAFYEHPEDWAYFRYNLSDLHLTDSALAHKPGDDDIRALRDEAGTAGDLEQVSLCDRALAGDDDAWAECARVITEARS